MNLEEFKQKVEEETAFGEFPKYLTEDILEILFSEENGEKKHTYLLLDDIPPLSRTVILFLDDGIFYTELDIMEQSDGVYINAGHINTIQKLQMERYFEIKKELEQMKKNIERNLKAMYIEKFEEANNMIRLFEPKN